MGVRAGRGDAHMIGRDGKTAMGSREKNLSQKKIQITTQK